MLNPFFKNIGPFNIDKLLSNLSILNGPTFLKKGLDIKEYLSKFLTFSVSTNITNYFLSTIVADHCASAIFLPSTKASPLYFQTLP